jgi:Protein of unknown function (DUF1566)
MHHRIRSFARFTACALLALAGSAHAVDLRSWDQKITDGTKRFVVLPSLINAAVLDKETQLVWERAPSLALLSFESARSFCDTLQRGGRMGWRLPSAPELRSLIEPGLTNPAVASLPAGHPFTTVRGAIAAYYWTTTQSASSENRQVLGIYPGGGYSYFPSLVSQYGVWCVRGPTSPGG